MAFDTDGPWLEDGTYCADVSNLALSGNFVVPKTCAVPCAVVAGDEVDTTESWSPFSVGGFVAITCGEESVTFFTILLVVVPKTCAVPRAEVAGDAVDKTESSSPFSVGVFVTITCGDVSANLFAMFHDVVETMLVLDIDGLLLVADTCLLVLPIPEVDTGIVVGKS